MAIRMMDPPEESSTSPVSTAIPEATPVPQIGIFEIKGLPSRNIPYNGIPIYGRKLNVLEVKETTNITPENIDEITDKILSSAISGIDPMKITTNDKLYLLFWLRAQTFIQDGFRVPFQCSIEGCEKSSVVHFNISDIDQIYLNEAYDPSWLTFTNPIDSKEIVFDFRRISDERSAKYFFDKMSKTMKMDISILNIAIQIKKINGQEVKLEESYQYLLSDPTIFAVCLSNMAKIEFGISPIVKKTCPECGGEAYSAISFRPEFFLPAYYTT